MPPEEAVGGSRYTISGSSSTSTFSVSGTSSTSHLSAARGEETLPLEAVSPSGATTQQLGGGGQPGLLQMLGGNEVLQRALQGAAGGAVQLGGAELEGLQQMLQQAGVASGDGTGPQQVQFVVLGSDGQQQTVQLQV